MGHAVSHRGANARLVYTGYRRFALCTLLFLVPGNSFSSDHWSGVFILVDSTAPSTFRDIGMWRDAYRELEPVNVPRKPVMLLAGKVYSPKS